MTIPNLKDQFDQDGFVILRSFFSEQEAQTLLDIIQTCPHPTNKDRLTKGAMTFYSNVYRYSKEMQAFAAQQKIVNVLKELSGPDIWMRHDQAVAKGPGADTFPWHQDNGYNKLKDGHYQFWIALTEMNQDNGGLWLQPGSHKMILPHKKVGNEQVYDGIPENPVAIEAKPGDVIIFSSFCLHSTTPNITQKQRWAYVLEYMSLDHFDPFLEPPYFIIAKDGKSCPEFVESYRGSKKLTNRLKYNLRMDGVIKRWLRRVLKKQTYISQ
ncbi:phytanoyl-CoA dioxygenase family protein [Leptolyngbya sp. AN02str]|uniref:phytanoyl-CoA dioxygenase family protein n=1 Tax=Leptolyngbya sp. AN02str TaxID=3423363 RepID=UPI003D31CDF1